MLVFVTVPIMVSSICSLDTRIRSSSDMFFILCPIACDFGCFPIVCNVNDSY